MTSSSFLLSRSWREIDSFGARRRQVSRGDVQNRWHACGCAHLGHVRSIYFPTGGNVVTQMFKFPRTNGKRGLELGDAIIPSSDVDGVSFRKASAPATARQAVHQP